MVSRRLYEDKTLRIPSPSNLATSPKCAIPINFIYVTFFLLTFIITLLCIVCSYNVHTSLLTQMDLHGCNVYTRNDRRKTLTDDKTSEAYNPNLSPTTDLKPNAQVMKTDKMFVGVFNEK